MALDDFAPLSTAPAFHGLYAFPNAIRDAPADPNVLSLIEDTGDLVREFLDINHTFAGTAITAALRTMDDLKLAVVPPALPDPPPAPAIVTSFGASVGIGFESEPQLGDLSPEAVTQFNPDAVTLPDIEGDIPVYTSLGLVVNIPDSPTLTDVAEPVEPGLDLDLDIPAVPAKDYGGTPDLDEITLPVYTAPVIPVFNDEAPEFDTLPPDPFIQWREPTYTSDIKDGVHDTLLAMLGGGTGLDADVELAIFERAAEREDATGRKTVDEAISVWASRGFDHPQGQLNEQVLAVFESGELKRNDLSRDIAIKQADLEQKNRQFAVEKALAYEQVFTAVFLAIVDRNFQIAKFGVETQIQVYNLTIAAFNVENSVYQSKIAKYRVDLDTQLVYLKAFEALVEVEKAKAEINTAKVQAYTARVNAYAQQVEAYKAVVQAVVAKGELQKNKVEIYKAQIDGMVAKINAQRSKFEAYESRIKGETAKVELEDANTKAYVAQVQGWSEKATVQIKRAELGFQANRQQLDWNIANMQRITATDGQQLNVIQARLAAFQANVARSTAKYGADTESHRFNLQAQVSLGQLAISKYQALMQQWTVRAQEVIQFGTVQAESLRAAGQMAANMVSGALAGTHVSAGLSAGTTAGQSSSRSTSDTTSQAKNQSENDNYSIVHNYQHRT